MAKKMLIDATHAEETRVVVVDGNKVEEFDFESENKRQLAGNIYLAKVTRVEPSLQAAFVEYGGNRHGFLAFSEIHPDYYQIPVADREALLAEENAYAEAQRELENKEAEPKSKRRSSSKRVRAQSAMSEDAVQKKDLTTSFTTGMETIDLDDKKTNAAWGDQAVETASIGDIEDKQNTSIESTGPSQSSLKSVEGKGQEVWEDSSQDDHEISEDEATCGEIEIRTNDATLKDNNIENVAELDDEFELRPAHKAQPRRYKIQEVIKIRQILLVQVVKEERGNKGAALTTYLSLAGRYCVLMPNTARGGGISRKITNAADRKKLKEIAGAIDVPQGAGLIIRTAGAKRTKIEVKRDYEYLQRLWEQIRELTLNSVAPSKIYEEGDLIKRSIRDLYNREIDEVLVEGERGYRIAKDFMKMIMPSHAKNVQSYQDALPLFARYQVESYLGSMFSPVVQLKSGGYIVIGVTEALVAVDVNSGRATKEGSIEETALKTNLEAADEVARQLRLRDLAGLIVIDFIDMDERRNNSAVEKRMKDRLKTDRARIQIGRISGFGLMEMSRQRLRPGMLEATTEACKHCHGTGLIRSEDSLALAILRQIEEEGVRQRSGEVLVKCPVPVANFLINQKREHIIQIEKRYGLSVRIESVITLVSPEYEIEKFKQASRFIPAPKEKVVSVDAMLRDQSPMAEDPEEQNEELPDHEHPEIDEARPKKRRRRRRRRRSKSEVSEEVSMETNSESLPLNQSLDQPEAQEKKSSDLKGNTSQSQDVDPPLEITDGIDSLEEPAKKPTRPRRTRITKKTKEPTIKNGSTATSVSKENNDMLSEFKSDAELPETSNEKKPKKVSKKRVISDTKSAKLISKPVSDLEIKDSGETVDLANLKEENIKVSDIITPPENQKGLNEDGAKSAQKPRRRGWWSRGENNT